MGPTGSDGSDGLPGVFLPGGSASTYINWGVADCPGAHSVVYTGRAVAPAFDNAGGGAEYICLHNTKNDGDLQIMSAAAMSTVVGVHLETYANPSAFGSPMNIEPLNDENGDAIECALCLTLDSNTIMVPNSNMCPSDAWNMAYTGFLMTARDLVAISSLNLNQGPVFGNPAADNHLRPHFRTEYVCLNQNFERDISGSIPPPVAGNPPTPSDEAKMSHVRMYCQSLVGLDADGCNPYAAMNPDDAVCDDENAHCSFGPLSCTVCTTSSLA